MKIKLDTLFRTISKIVMITLLAACGPSPENLAAVDYTPISNEPWPVSTPEEQGLDPKLVTELYYNASRLETIYSLLVFKNGYLIAEDYFHSGSPDLQVNIHSVTKSINSALVGIAFGHVLYYRGIHRLGPVVSSGIMLATPFVTYLGAAVFLGERLSGMELFGGLLVVAGGALLVASRAQIERDLGK